MLKRFFASKGAKKTATLAVKEDEVFVEDLPLSVLIGSMKDAAKKDVLAYAKSRAETNEMAKEITKIGVFKDKGSDRWIYEIHEGGAGFEMAADIIDFLRHGESSAYLKLANDSMIQVSDIEQEIVTIAYPKGMGPKDVHLFEGAKKGKLTPITGDGSTARLAGKSVMWVGALCFAVGALVYGLNASLTDVQRLITQTKEETHGAMTANNDLPFSALERAKNEVRLRGGYISSLKYENNRWQWERNENILMSRETNEQ